MTKIVQFSTHLKEISFTHCRREGNIVVHEAAKAAVDEDLTAVWLEEAPSTLHHVLQEDLGHISDRGVHLF